MKYRPDIDADRTIKLKDAEVIASDAAMVLLQMAAQDPRVDFGFEDSDPDTGRTYMLVRNPEVAIPLIESEETTKFIRSAFEEDPNAYQSMEYIRGLVLAKLKGQTVSHPVFIWLENCYL